MKLHEEIFMMNGYDGKSEGVDLGLPRPTSSEHKDTSYEVTIKEHAALLLEIKDRNEEVCDRIERSCN
jgi:hypothetical protein